MSRVSAEFSPQSYARTGGLLYLLIIAAGLFAEFVRERFVVPGDAATTAKNITDHAFMFPLGLAADLSTLVCAVALTIILYVLLKPFGRNAALLMLGFNLVQDAIGGLNVLNTSRPLQLLGGAAYLKVFSREQLEAMALLSLNTHSVGFAVAMMFFGCSCVALGYLTFVAGLFPKPSACCWRLRASAISHSALHSSSLPGWLRCCSRQSSCRHSSVSYRLQCG